MTRTINPAGLLDRLVDHPQLGPQLCPGAGLVHRPDDPLPEPPPHRQDRVVLDQQAAVAGGEPDLGGRQLPLDFAAVLLQQGPERFFRALS